MIEKPIGMRVYAIRDSDDAHVYLYGFGTYQGEKNPFGNISPSNAEWRKAERQLRKHDEKPIDVGKILRAKRAHLMSDEQIDGHTQAYEERHELDKSLPMDERVRLLLSSRETKPCIYLDSGVIVWGSEVLWGPYEKWDRYLRGREAIEIPPPYDAQRWKEDNDGGTGSATHRSTDEQAGATRPTRLSQGTHRG